MCTRSSHINVPAISHNPALEQQWLQSQKTNNPDLLAPLLADKFVSTGNDGKVTGKAETLATAKSKKYDSAEYEDVKVTAFDNTAIATAASKVRAQMLRESLSKPMSVRRIPG